MKSSISSILIFLSLPILVFAQEDNPNLPQVKVIGEDHTINCTSAPVQIGVRVDHWQPGFTYEWTHGPTDSVIAVKPAQTRVYEVNVKNEMLNYDVTRSIEVRVFNAPMVVNDESITVDKFTCPGKEMHLGVDPIGGYAPYSFAWSDGQTSDAPAVSPTEDTEYRVTVTDVCGTNEEALVAVRFEAHDPLIAPEQTTVLYTCEGESVDLKAPLAQVKGGVGHGYSYSFDEWETKNESFVTEASEGLVHYQVTDACGIQIGHSTIELIPEELETPEASDLMVCRGGEVEVTSSTDDFYYWDGSVMHTSFSSTFEDDESIELLYIDVCGQTHKTKRDIVIDAIDTEFEMNINHLDRKATAYAPITPGATYTWLLNGEPVGEGESVELELQGTDENIVVLDIENENGCSEQKARTIVLQDGVEIPSAFSPNGDGVNDRFSMTFEDELQSFHIKIFNRWGQLIFQSNDQYFEWDGFVNGKATSLESYAYILRAETVSGREIKKQGTISTLIVD